MKINAAYAVTDIINIRRRLCQSLKNILSMSISC
jgi:hypothetical protein